MLNTSKTEGGAKREKLHYGALIGLWSIEKKGIADVGGELTCSL